MFPFTDPVLIFASVMILILIAPFAARKLRLPEIVGLIIAGIIAGPYGFGLLERKGEIDLLGTVGLLYIMFLAGLEIDLNQVKRNKSHSIIFGLLTFSIPLVMGVILGVHILGMSVIASILLASMFSSHTLVTFPLITKLGLSKSPSVTTTIGGTIITDTLALLILAVITSASQVETTAVFWIRLFSFMIVYIGAIILLLPRTGRWFLNRFSADENLEFVFVIAITFLCAYLAHFAELEPILGAFLAGLTFNTLIPERSVLMTRIHFVGDALFIPFFLLSVGMLVDIRLLFTSHEALIVAGGMTAVALSAKLIAAVLSAKSLGYNFEEGKLMFGLSVNQAAATLAVVLIGFNIGLFDDSIITGTIMMIAVTCLVGSISTERAGRAVALLQEKASFDPVSAAHRILVPLQRQETAKKLLDIAFLLHAKGSSEALYPIRVVQEQGDTEQKIAAAERVLANSVIRAVAASVPVMPITTIDINIQSGILRSIRDYRISLVLLEWDGVISSRARMFGRIIDQVIQRSTQMLLVNYITRPIATIKRIVLLFPPYAERETGFSSVITTIKTLANQAATTLLVIVSDLFGEDSKEFIQNVRPIVQVSFSRYGQWKNIGNIVSSLLQKDDGLFLMGVRKNEIAWQPFSDRLPRLLTQSHPGTFLSIIFAPSERWAAQTPVSSARLFSIFRPECTFLGLEVDNTKQLIQKLLSCEVRDLSERAENIASNLYDISQKEPVELAKGIVLLHTYISNLTTSKVFLGVSNKPLEIPLVTVAPRIMIILLDPLEQDPAKHLQVLSDIVKLVQIPEITTLLHESRNYEELVIALERIEFNHQ